MNQAFVVELKDMDTVDNDINKKLVEMEEDGYLMIKSHHIEIGKRQAILIIGKKYTYREKEYGYTGIN